MFPVEVPGGAGPLDGGLLSFCAPWLSRGGSGAVDTTDKDGPSELGQGPSPCADGHSGWPLTRIHAVGITKHVSICRERGLHDGQEGGWQPPLVSPSLGPPVTPGQSWTQLSGSKSHRGAPRPISRWMSELRPRLTPRLRHPHLRQSVMGGLEGRLSSASQISMITGVTWGPCG